MLLSGDGYPWTRPENSLDRQIFIMFPLILGVLRARLTRPRIRYR